MSTQAHSPELSPGDLGYEGQDPRLPNYIDEMPELVRENIILRRKVWPRMHIRNENWMCIIVGETGEGKSYAALRLAEILDPEFSMDRVAGDVEEFLELADDDTLGTGSVQVLEEAGVAAANRNWYEDANQVLDFLTQTWRSQNRGAIMTVPDFDLIDEHVQRRFHHLIVMQGKDATAMQSKAKIKFIQTNNEYGTKYRKYHRFEDERGRRQKYKFIKFNLPSNGLIDEYERWKDQFTSDLRSRLLTRLRENKADNREKDLSPAEITEQIISEKGVEGYISESNSGPYLNRNLIKVDYDCSEADSKTVKDLLKRECDLDGVM